MNGMFKMKMDGVGTVTQPKENPAELSVEQRLAAAEARIETMERQLAGLASRFTFVGSP